MLADVGTTQLFYEAIGRGPTVLAMHGGLGLDHSYLRSHDVLADAHRVVYYDHRGNGRSPRGEAATIDHACWHDDAAALLDRLGTEKAIVVGHSYGSWLALGFALRYPQRVSALVLCGAAPAFDYVPEIEGALATRPPALTAKFMAAITEPPQTDEAFRAMWLDILPLYFHRYEPRHARAFADVHYAAGGYLLGAAQMPVYNVVAQLPRLAVPTLILAGGDDFITPIAQSHRIQAAAPGVEVVELAASGHYPFLEEPDRYFSALRGWLGDRS